MLHRGWSWRISALSCLLVTGAWLSAAEPDLDAVLPVDPKVTMGVLDNGMHYWLRANQVPPGKATLRLYVRSGSINEEDTQRGLAHFLEHMAFNGSENFPPGSLVKFFEKMGLTFGRDQNASTGYDATCYILNLPDAKTETLRTGLLFLGDVAFALTLSAEEVIKERAVVLEEARARKGVGQRVQEKLIAELAPHSRLPLRMPIGTPEVISTAERPLVEAYYRKWYRPDTTTLLVVGDIDVATTAKLIQERFGAWKPAPQTPAADPGIQTQNAQRRAAVIADPELTEADVSIYALSTLPPYATVRDFRQELVEYLGYWIVNRRFATQVEAGTAPFQSAHAGFGPFMNVCKISGISASGRPDQWRQMLNGLVVEVRRARQFGFLDQELADARKALLATAEQAARREATESSGKLIETMNQALVQRRKPLADAQELTLLQALLPGVTVAEVNTCFNEKVTLTTPVFLLKLPEKAGVTTPSHEEVLQALKDAEAAPIVAPTATTRPKSLLAQEPAGGKIVAQTEEPDLKILSVTLDNGVRVHVRQMDYRKNQVYAYICVGGATLLETAETRGLSEIAALALRQPATAQLSSTVIREMMTGRNVSVSGSAGEDAFVISLSGAPQDLAEGLRLAYALFTAGKIEEAALKLWKENTLQELAAQRTNVEDMMRLRVGELLRGNDPRSRVLTEAQVQALTLPAGQRWLEQALREGPIEACIVGDIDRTAALELARQYLGALPVRKQSTDELKKLRRLSTPLAPISTRIEVETLAPKSMVLCGWRGANWPEVKDRRVLQLAAAILQSRLHQDLREERGLTYSVGCMAQPAQVYPESGLFAAVMTADPAKAEEVVKITRDAILKFAKDGPTEVEMETVRKQMKNQLDVMFKEPSYWAGVLKDLDYRGTRLQDVKELCEKMGSYTREDILDALARYLKEERRIEVIALPAPAKKAKPEK